MRIFYFILVTITLIENSYPQKSEDYCELFKRTIQIYNENSVSPIQVKNFDEVKFRNNILKTLDADYLIFNSAIDSLFNVITKTLKQNLFNSYCNNRETLIKYYRTELESTLHIFEGLNNYECGFDTKDSIYVGYGVIDNIYSLKKEERCEKFIKALVLQDIFETASKYDSLSRSKATMTNYIDSVKRKLIDKEIKHIKNILETDYKLEERVHSAYINSILTQFDPYSYLFLNNAFNDFREQLSTHIKSFGIQLQFSNGALIVSSIKPGSYAWRTGLVNSGDEILAFKADNQKVLQIKNVEIEEVAEYLNAISTDKLSVTLLKANVGTKKEVILYRENLEQIENSVQAFILRGTGKIGYIALPAFYTSWDTQELFGCSQDIGRAIYLLKKENIESLIIDLRNNGGGSLVEAIDLAGIFVDFGTLSIAQDKNENLTSIKDFNRGTLYSGPLALLVNNNSASASEMVAAVLQDYNRAIVIGDTTFGKATGQSLIPVDSEDNIILKVTTNKYYRVTGKTYYKVGVIPDVMLPTLDKLHLKDHFDNEKLQFPDSVDKKIYYVPWQKIAFNELINNSYGRIINNEKFQKISLVDSLIGASALNNEYLPLNFATYHKLTEQKETIEKELNTINESRTSAFEVELLQKDKEASQVYKYYSDLYSELSGSILVDPYIEEAFNILIDYKMFKK